MVILDQAVDGRGARAGRLLGLALCSLACCASIGIFLLVLVVNLMDIDRALPLWKQPALYVFAAIPLAIFGLGSLVSARVSAPIKIAAATLSVSLVVAEGVVLALF